MLLKPLPFAEPDRLYWVYSRHTSTDRYPFPLPEFCDYRDRTRTLEAVAGFANWSANLSGDEAAERVPGLRVSGNFFDTLGVAAAVGRTLRPADDIPGHEKVVVLSHGLWQRRFGGDPGVVGRTLTLNGEPFTVVGVIGPGFPLPRPRHRARGPARPGPGPVAPQARVDELHPRDRARAGRTPDRAQVTPSSTASGGASRRSTRRATARKKGVLVIPTARS